MNIKHTDLRKLEHAVVDWLAEARERLHEHHLQIPHPRAAAREQREDPPQ